MYVDVRAGMRSNFHSKFQFIQIQSRAKSAINDTGSKERMGNLIENILSRALEDASTVLQIQVNHLAAKKKLIINTIKG